MTVQVNRDLWVSIASQGSCGGRRNAPGLLRLLGHCRYGFRSKR